jgi:hypothetical protein
MLSDPTGHTPEDIIIELIKAGVAIGSITIVKIGLSMVLPVLQSVPTTGEPGTTVPIPGGSRTYGPDGRAETDKHDTDHGTPNLHPNPHGHDWNWDDSKNPTPGPAYPWPKVTVPTPEPTSPSFGVRVLVSNPIFLFGAFIIGGAIEIFDGGGCSGGIDEYGNPITCFTSDTLIKTNSGLVPIMDIKVDDMVYAYDDVTGNMAYKRVVMLFSNSSSQMVYITINGAIIKATPEHPFYLEGMGWVGAGDIHIGDKVKLSTGKTAIVEDVKKIELETPIAVYNFSVDDYHTYFVSELEVLVHNKCR